MNKNRHSIHTKYKNGDAYWSGWYDPEEIGAFADCLHSVVGDSNLLNDQIEIDRDYVGGKKEPGGLCGDMSQCENVDHGFNVDHYGENSGDLHKAEELDNLERELILVRMRSEYGGDEVNWCKMCVSGDAGMIK
jgi:hypothetical protein